MKYKLINKTTGEETLCDKVTIDGFDYWVNDSFLRINDYGYWEDSSTISQISDITAVLPETKKVIATNNPNIDIPKVVDEVERLAYEHCDTVIPKDTTRSLHYSFKCGYSKSQQTHPFSEEDMIEFSEWCQKPSLEDLRQPNVVYIPSGNFYWHKHKKYTPKELLQLWKEQKIKTLYYE